MEDDAEERGQGGGKNLENGKIGNEMGWDLCGAFFFFLRERENRYG